MGTVANLDIHRIQKLRKQTAAFQDRGSRADSAMVAAVEAFTAALEGVPACRSTELDRALHALKNSLADLIDEETS